MARKLGLGGLTLAACALLAGCQSGSNSRLASNTTQNNPALAKQSTLPPPNFPNTTTSTGRAQTPATPTGFSSAFPQQPNMTPLGTAQTSGSALPGTPNIAPMTPNQPAPGLQSSGAPTTSNRQNNVTFTQPDAPALPPLPQQQQPPLAPPGISPIPMLPN